MENTFFDSFEELPERGANLSMVAKVYFEQGKLTRLSDEVNDAIGRDARVLHAYSRRQFEEKGRGFVMLTVDTESSVEFGAGYALAADLPASAPGRLGGAVSRYDPETEFVYVALLDDGGWNGGILACDGNNPGMDYLKRDKKESRFKRRAKQWGKK